MLNIALLQIHMNTVNLGLTPNALLSPTLMCQMSKLFNHMHCLLIHRVESEMYHTQKEAVENEYKKRGIS